MTRHDDIRQSRPIRSDTDMIPLGVLGGCNMGRIEHQDCRYVCRSFCHRIFDSREKLVPFFPGYTAVHPWSREL